MGNKHEKQVQSHSFADSSTPLGMLFDHGSDAVSAFLIAIQVLKILQVPLPVQLLALYIHVMSTYFCAMWSQYCVGHFRLGRINPVDEGLPAYALLSLIAIGVDLSFLADPHILGTYSEEIIYLLLLLLIPLIFFMCKDLFKNRKVPLSEAMFMPILYVVAGISILSVYLCVPKFEADVAYPFFYATMFFWSRNMICIQLNYITNQKYRVFNRGTVSFVSLCAIYCLFRRQLPISDCGYFVIMCVIEGVIFFEFVVRVLNEGAEILGIRIFSLKKRGKNI
jgi:hypothetical protein